MKRPAMAIELRFALELLDALHDGEAGAADELERVGSFLPASATIPVEGGAEGEAMRPLDFSPVPGRPLRELIADDVIADALDDSRPGRTEPEPGTSISRSTRRPPGRVARRSSRDQGPAGQQALGQARSGRLSRARRSSPGRPPTKEEPMKYMLLIHQGTAPTPLA